MGKSTLIKVKFKVGFEVRAISTVKVKVVTVTVTDFVVTVTYSLSNACYRVIKRYYILLYIPGYYRPSKCPKFYTTMISGEKNLLQKERKFVQN